MFRIYILLITFILLPIKLQSHNFDFDFFIYAYSWNLEYCQFKKRKNPKCTNIPNNFNFKMRPHGLWPSYFPKNNKLYYPQNCRKETFNMQLISNKVNGYIDDLYYYSKGLASHEWLKHGTCTNFNQNDYFDNIKKINMMMNNKFTIVQDNIGKSITFNDLISAYGGKQYVNIICNFDKKLSKQFLKEIRVFFDKDLKNMINIPSQKVYRNRCNKKLPIYIRKYEY